MTRARDLSNFATPINTVQPAFLAQKDGGQDNMAIDSNVTITFETEIFDQNADYNVNGTFTAPVTGKYQFNFSVRVGNLDETADFSRMLLITSNRTYFDSIIDPAGFDQDLPFYHFNFSVLADMDANDTAIVAYNQGGGAAQVDAINDQCHFSGFLAC